MKTRFLIFALLMFSAAKLSAQPGKFESDVIETSGGKLTMYFVGHASLLFDFNGKMIYVDPWNNQTDFSKFPKADLILITHQHYDHMDPKAVDDLSKNGTQIVETKTVFDVLVRGTAMKNGEKKTIDGIGIEAVPAYNTTKGRDIFHPKGRDNGYVLTFGNKKVYVAGDTENVPEMASLKGVDIAFLPMNQPYTMTPEQLAAAAKAIHPGILYPYHTGDTDVSKLKPLLSDTKSIELRIRKLP